MVLYEKSGNTKRQADLTDFLVCSNKPAGIRDKRSLGVLRGKENVASGSTGRDLEFAIMRSKEDARKNRYDYDDEENDKELRLALELSKRQYEEQRRQSHKERPKPIVLDNSDVEEADVDHNSQNDDRSDDDDFQCTRPPRALKRLSQKTSSPVRTKSSPQQKRERQSSSNSQRTSSSVSQDSLKSSLDVLPTVIQKRQQDEEEEEVWEFDLSNIKQEKATQQQQEEENVFELDLSNVKQEIQSTQKEEEEEVFELDLSNVKQELEPPSAEPDLEINLSDIPSLQRVSSTDNRSRRRVLPVIFTPSPSPSPPLIPRRDNGKQRADNIFPPSPNSPSSPNDDAATRKRSRKGKERIAPVVQVIDDSSDNESTNNMLPRRKRRLRDTHTSTFSNDDLGIGTSSRNVECPLCYRSFPSDKIEEHASTCNDPEATTTQRSPSLPPRRPSTVPQLAHRLCRSDTFSSPQLDTLESDIEEFEDERDQTSNRNNLQSCIYCSDWIPSYDMDRHVSEKHSSLVDDADSDCSVIDLCDPRSDDDGYLSPLEGFVALDEENASNSMYQQYLERANTESDGAQVSQPKTNNRRRSNTRSNRGNGNNRGRFNYYRKIRRNQKKNSGPPRKTNVGGRKTRK